MVIRGLQAVIYPLCNTYVKKRIVLLERQVFKAVFNTSCGNSYLKTWERIPQHVWPRK